MSIIVYDSKPSRIVWRQLNPICIVKDLIKYRELIVSMTMQNFRSAYQASYLGIAWQIILPLIMLSIFYFVFGVVLGGRFSNIASESPVDYALALFVGLGFFNFLAQNMGQAPSLITANHAYVKTLSFPLEILPLTIVLNSLLTLAINIMITVIVLLLAKGSIHLSAICSIFYLTCIFLVTIGISWVFSALAVFVRDITAIISPLTLILMFMCPIFYPASMVPKRIKWIIQFNPLAAIIEDVRASLLYGRWPTINAMLFVGIGSLALAVFGYFIFMRFKSAFADVI